MTETARSVGSALRDLRSHLRLWPVAAAGLALDLWSKAWAFRELDADPNASRTVIPHLLSFRRTLNAGALFGLGKGLWPIFVAASILALGFVLYLFAHSTSRRRSLHIALGCILAGAVGNLYDRAFVIADVVKTARGTKVGIVLAQDDRGVTIASWPDRSHPEYIAATYFPVVRQQGVVRDFLKIEPSIGRFEMWPWVFNVADVLLVVGVGLLLLNFLWERREAVEAAGILHE